MLVLTVSLIAILLLIVYQDFKKFEVSLLLYVLGIIISGVNYWLMVSRAERYFYLSVNLGLIAVSILWLMLYFYIRYKKIRFFQYIGWGDLLFFVIAALNFSIVNFLFFQLVSFIIALAIGFVLKKKNEENKKLIPLAGCQSIVLVMALLLNMFSEAFNPYNDDYLVGLILK